jgi:AraC-like DNA-binding protein
MTLNRFWEAQLTQLRERLGECRSFSERVRVADSLLLCQSLQSRRFSGISAAAEQVMLAGGRVSVHTLADTAEMSMRQFERRFVEEVGIRPKLFARIARFGAALNNKARFAHKPWTDVAHDFGYYDQMHLVHDFTEFTGGTPTETLRELETVFVEQIRLLRNCRVRANTDARLVL